MIFLRLVKPGDWLVFALAATFTAAILPFALRGGRAELAIVKSGGRVVAELPLTAPRSGQNRKGAN